MKTLVGWGIAACVFGLARSPHRGVHLMVFLIASETVACFALYRPQLITYLLLSFVLLLLARFKERIGRVAIAIPFVIMLWANLHGGFLAGLALLAGYSGASLLRGLWMREDRRAHWTFARRLALVLALSVAATLLNPYGFQLWETLGHELSVNDLNRQYIAEWASFNTRSSFFGLDGQSMLFMALLAFVGFSLRRREWSMEDLGLALGTFILGLYSVRNIPFFVLMTAAPVARSLGGYMSESQDKAWVRRLFLLALAVAITPAFLMAYLVFQDPSPAIKVRAENMGGNPSRAVAFIVANEAHGNFFNPLGWGGYLLWHLPPEMKISVDGRSSTVYSRDILADTYRFYANEASADVPLERGADFVLVEAKSPVVPTMNSDARWRLVYEDKDALVYAGPTEAGKRLTTLLDTGSLKLPDAAIKVRFP
jgi:hypothetical protein